MTVNKLLLVVALLAATSCNLNNIDINDPTPVPSATPTPVPSATPTPVPPSNGVSDVAGMIMTVFGYDCAAGVPEPNHFAAVIPSQCTTAKLTATPKQANGDDARFHGNAITWTATGSGANIEPDPGNVLFNRVVSAQTPRVAGLITLEARLVAPDGRIFTASKTVTIQQ